MCSSPVAKQIANSLVIVLDRLEERAKLAQRARDTLTIESPNPEKVLCLLDDLSSVAELGVILPIYRQVIGLETVLAASINALAELLGQEEDRKKVHVITARLCKGEIPSNKEYKEVVRAASHAFKEKRDNDGCMLAGVLLDVGNFVAQTKQSAEAHD